MNAKALKIIAAASSLAVSSAFADSMATPKTPAQVPESFSELDSNNDQALDRTELDSIGVYGLTIDEVFTRYDVDDSQTISEPEFRGMRDYLSLEQESYSNTAPDNGNTGEPLSMQRKNPPDNSDVDVDLNVQTVPSEPITGSALTTPPTPDTQPVDQSTNQPVDQPTNEVVQPNLDSQAETNDGSVAELEWSEKKKMQNSASETLSETTPQTGAAPNEVTIAENVYTADVSEIIGTEVQDDSGQRLGEVESIMIDKQGMEAGVVIATDQNLELFTSVKYLRLENDALVIIDGVTPKSGFDQNRFREIEPSAGSINSALRRLELSHTR